MDQQLPKNIPVKEFAQQTENELVYSDDESVKIIDFGNNFSPYKSHLEKEICEEIWRMEKAVKGEANLANWKWDEVVDLENEICEDENEIFEEIWQIEKAKKRETNLANWKWDEVVDLEIYDEMHLTDYEDFESDLSEADAVAQPPKKIPRITIQRRNRVLRIIDLSDDGV